MSANRRDGTVVIKKKVPGGTSNGGTYYTLASGKFTVPYGSWQAVRATVQNTAGGSVTLALYSGSQLLLQARDGGVGGAPITSAGRVGIRGDNCEFQFDNFQVASL